MLRNRRGFTLIEVIVVAAIIAILAGILVPMIFSQIDESKITKAKGDCKTIQTAVMTFRKDVGMWPYYSDLTTTPPTTITVLYSGSGAAPAVPGGFDDTSTIPLSDHLAKNTYNYDATKWKGPYISDISVDPWGKAYVINSKDFDANPPVPVWVLSPGPDGVYCATTLATSTEIASGCDDIGVRIK